MKELLRLTILEDDDGNKLVGVQPADGIDQQTALNLLEDFVINTAMKIIDDSLSVDDYSEPEDNNDSMDVQ